MTVQLAANAPVGSSWLTVAGTSGGQTRTATPVVVNVQKTSGGFGPVGINFVGASPMAMAASETAGVVPMSHWNNAAGHSSVAPVSVVDAGGTPTGALVTWRATTSG